MAGAGYKLFNTGDVLTAAQVNTYLQEQAVMRFANAAARTTALSGVLAEGMVSYLMDTDQVEVYNGTAWVGAGSGDITEVTTAANSGLTGGATSGAVALRINTTAKGSIIAGTGATTLGELTVGANNTVLTADSTTATGLKWATPSAGGMTELASGSLSSTAVNITSISGSYKNLRLVVRNFRTSTDNFDLRMRFQNDSNSRYSVSSNPQVVQTFNQTSMYIATGQDNATSDGIAVVDIFDYTNTTTWKNGVAYSVSNDATTPTSVSILQQNFVYNQTGAITQINLISTGTAFASGTYILYGVS